MKKSPENRKQVVNLRFHVGYDATSWPTGGSADSFCAVTSAARWLLRGKKWQVPAHFFLLGSAVSTFALGVRIPNQDPAAIARGNAFVATADNPSAIYYNPAGITQLKGHNAQVGALAYMNIYADYQSPSGNRTENDTEIIPVPQLHYSFTPEGSFYSLGLGVYSPFGLSMKWPDDSPFATRGIEGKLTYITVNPVLALRLHPTLSIAAGPTFNHSELELRQAVGMVAGDRFKFKGDNFGYGFNVGLLWQPYEEWSFGLTYKSKVSVDHEGTASITPAPPFPGSFSSSAPLDFPQIITGGISFRPTKDWNIEFDVDWTDWSSVEDLVVTGASTTTLDWHPSFFYEFGVTRNLSGGYYASAGYFYSQESTSERYFLPTVPDTDLHVGSIGVGYKGARWTWAAAVQLIAGGWRKIDNNVNPSVNGKYKLLTPTLSLSAGYHF